MNFLKQKVLKHFMHLTFAIHFSESLVTEEIFCLAADVQSGSMLNIRAGADPLQ